MGRGNFSQKKAALAPDGPSLISVITGLGGPYFGAVFFLILPSTHVYVTCRIGMSGMCRKLWVASQVKMRQNSTAFVEYRRNLTKFAEWVS
jgi:hypothetical protein